jgi:hypothetical protein
MSLVLVTPDCNFLQTLLVFDCKGVPASHLIR